MYQTLIAMISAKLLTASPQLLTRIAAALSKYIGKPVAAKSAEILAAIKSYVRGNSTTALVIANLLASAGLEIAIDQLKEKAVGNPTYSHLVMEIESAINKFSGERSMLTGDQKDTVHGQDKAQLSTAVETIAAANQIISNAARMVGGVDALRTIRAAVFLEEADFENYRALSR